MKPFIIFSFCMIFSNQFFAQTTFNKDIAPIIYNHCTSCHRSGEIGPFSLTSFEEVKNWASTILYVTNSRYMPPWKADPSYSHFLDENYLTDTQIDKIKDWVTNGTIEGNEADVTPLPSFPQGSLLGKPDLTLSFKNSYVHKGNGTDEYRYFVLPTGLTEAKKLKAIEMRPGNRKIVHHALFFSDVTGKPRQYDNLTTAYGFSPNDHPDFDVFEVINQEQFPGYVPGQKPRYFPDGLAKDLPANSDLVIQIHYAPNSIDESDSSSVNLFFADDTEVIDRTVKDYIMLPYNLPGGFASFRIPGNQVKKFEGTYTIPFDVSLIGVFPHMHLLGTKWEVYMDHPDGAKTNLIKVNDWDFNWQGGYYFQKYMVAKKGTKIKAFATYDNTTNNLQNPNNPPKLVAWGEGTKDEMYYLPLLYVPYRNGDENISFVAEPTATLDADLPVKAHVFPNPSIGNSTQPVSIAFELKVGNTVNIDILNQTGQVIRTLKKGEYFGTGPQLVHWNMTQIEAGTYFVKLTTAGTSITIPYVIVQ